MSPRCSYAAGGAIIGNYDIIFNSFPHMTTTTYGQKQFAELEELNTKQNRECDRSRRNEAF